MCFFGADASLQGALVRTQARWEVLRGSFPSACVLHSVQWLIAGERGASSALRNALNSRRARVERCMQRQP